MARVLVVDDDDDIRDIIAYALRQRGHDVSSCDDPLAALALATSEPFEVALLDWSMPVMDGGELCALLRELPDMRDAPIVIVTAHGDQDTRDRASAAGATRFVSKPFSLKQLADLVAELLDRPS